MIEIEQIPSKFNELTLLLETVMLTDRRALSKLWSDIQESKKQEGEKQSKSADAQKHRFIQMLKQSQERIRERKQALPVVTYPDSLPISERREEIAELISMHQVIILAGETGSGKTTQLPKICLDLGRGIRGQIGHTQPRRIAASSVASRIAEELNTSIGESVGFQVRFTDQSSPLTHLKLMTDGILLAEIQHDPLLYRYDTLIIDEAHERSLNIDFLLGYLKQILPKRPDLKLIVTSATIDLEKFSKHFNNAPIIEVSGRTFPVEIIYRPCSNEVEDASQPIVEALAEILALPMRQTNDILVFMTGEKDIRDAAQAIRKANFPNLDVLPLYARLSLSEQKKVFQNHKGRRVVLATNVAETSITVPGIGFVIDPGYARISRYSVRTKVQRLPIEAISQASANQRAGRCGRVSSGVCIRLYEEADLNSRPIFTDAEILRTNLASVVLQMIHLGIGEIKRFPFIDPPDSKQINDGYKLLEELQAVKAKGKLTKLGRQLATLPVDPKLARMLLAAQDYNCLRETLIIASALSIQDPRERPAEKRQASDEKHRRFLDETSDFAAYINLWNYAETQRQELSQNQWSKLCKKEFLSYLRMREWREVHHQIRVACKKIGLVENNTPSDYQTVHKSLLSGLLGNIGLKSDEKGELVYLGARNRKFSIFPGSSQFKKRSKWIVAAELLETSRLYAHGVAKIEPEWVLDLAKHLVKHHYYEPHYNPKTGQVLGYDRITLYGLVLSEKSTINYGHIDAVLAREIFIRGALVEGGYAKSFTRNKGLFYEKNMTTIDLVQSLEAKSRRRDIMVEDEVLYQFYNERIPSEIVNLGGFEHWRKIAEQSQPDVLVIPQHLLMQHGAADITEAQFPDTLTIDSMTLPLSYHFDPKHPDDGVSVGVPAGILHTLPPERLDWLVPGLLRDKCIALIKTLPKQWRKQFVPVPYYVDQIMPRLKPSKQSLTDALQQELQRLLGKPLPDDLWRDVAIESFYLMNIHVIDEQQKIIDRGRDLLMLRERYRDHVQTTLQIAGEEIERESIQTWDFGPLQESCILKRGGIDMRAFPALVVEKDKVALRMLDNPVTAAVESKYGIVELLSQKMGHTIKYLQQNILKNKDMALSVLQLGSRGEVVKDLINAAVFDACLSEQTLPKNVSDFNLAAERGNSKLVSVAVELEEYLLEILSLAVEIKTKIKSHRNALALAMTVCDIHQQLNMLICPRFLSSTPKDWLSQYPRYLKAILVRLEKAPQDVPKDKQLTRLLSDYWQKHSNKLQVEGEHAYQNNPDWQQYRWMLEELRVSLFAQSLKTRFPISEKRINKHWQEHLK